MFHDVETQRLAAQSARVAYADGGFVTRELLAALNALDMPDATVIYGSGLEANPHLLKAISRRFRVAGNIPGTVSLVKSPRRFFPLLDSLEIAYPETRLRMPCQLEGWLSKRAGGSGGTHVRYFDGAPADYYQREVPGKPVSVLFLADGVDAAVVGFNEQWLAPASHMPFRYGGAVGNTDLSSSAKAVMTRAVQRVTAAAGLRGLNSMDFVLEGDTPLALEVNPRLSASFELYDIPELLNCHLQSCAGELCLPRHADKRACAQYVVYAEAEFRVDDAMKWPHWVADIPVAGTCFQQDDPLCTVRAQGATATEARTLAFARARELEAQLRQLY